MEKPRTEFEQIYSTLRKKFPQMFANIPDGYKHTIVDYALKKYKNLENISFAFENLIKDDKYAIRIFNLNALANFFGYELEYDKGYLHYERATKGTEPQGLGFNFDLSTFKNLHRSVKDVKARIDKNLEIVQIIEKSKESLATRWIQYENLVLKELLLEQELLKVFDHKKIADPLYHKLAEFLVQSYKIHLMPVDQDLYRTAIILFKGLKENPNLRGLINNFKIRVEDNVVQNPETGKPDIIMPLFVIYPAVGKESAQQLLNLIYRYFNNEIKGNGQVPRWNAKVTDLIFIAQGDGSDKTDENKEYFESHRVYYRSDITGTRQNYHLRHPETGKEIV